MKLVVHQYFSNQTTDILNVIIHFNRDGILFTKGSRNTIKIFPTQWKELNVKAFKIPNFINKIVYRFFRDSKAKRSYDYALRLIENNIGTPFPIAYAEYTDGIGFGKSFYVCEHIHADYTYRDLVEDSELENKEELLRAFTRFCFQLHEAGIEFKDHSPGNTLIKKESDGTFSFYLVDLNRMNFHQKMSFDLRMFNMRRLTPQKEMIEIMADEYAKCYGNKTSEEVLEKMWKYTYDFQQRFFKKQRMKKHIKFWKK